MEFRVLGPLEILDDSGGVVHLRAAKERSLFLSLLLHANEVVSSGRLIEDIWGERRPESAAKVIHTYVSHLRRLLQPGLQGANHELILTRHAGLSASPRARAARSRSLRGARRRSAFAGRPGKRGRVAAAKRSGSGEGRRCRNLRSRTSLGQRSHASRISGSRWSASGSSSKLRLGRHGDLVGELEALVAEHPLREQLRGQLMRALYGSGRQAEALQAYKETRRLLVEELGIEPSLPLRELEQAMLRHDAVLEPAARAVASDETPPAVSSESEPTVERPRLPDVRKTVTIVFSDLVDSSWLSRQLDPEAHRNLLARLLRCDARGRRAAWGHRREVHR